MLPNTKYDPKRSIATDYWWILHEKGLVCSKETEKKIKDLLQINWVYKTVRYQIIDTSFFILYFFSDKNYK